MRVQRLEKWWERFGETRPGRIVTHPAFLVLSCLVALAGAATAVVLVVAAQGRQTDIARSEAARAVAKAAAVQKQQQQQDAAYREAQRRIGEEARKQLCDLVEFNADVTTVPPSTPRGYYSAEKWREFGGTPLLHCATSSRPAPPG